LFDLLSLYKKDIRIKKIELLDNLNFKSMFGVDQTRYTFAESAIEVVIQKL
jgi:hypothetical protein